MNIRAELLKLAEPDYQVFASRLLPGTPHILGVRLPYLRKMAQKIVKEGATSFLSEREMVYFEEVMLRGMVIGYLKNLPLERHLYYIKEFVPLIDNWSVCDSFCSGLKVVGRHPEYFWSEVTAYLKSTNEFEVRFGVVMLLNYYVNNRYVEQVLGLLEETMHSGYYVRMAIAWAISVCYVNYPQLTLRYLQKTTLDTFTYNKALQKIRESLKTDSDTRALMKQMKRNEKTAPPS